MKSRTRLLCSAALVICALLFNLVLTSKSGVAFCADVFTQDCKSARHSIGFSPDLASRGSRDALESLERVVSESELEPLVIDSKLEKPQAVYSGNVALSHGNCATSCEWFGNVTTKQPYCKDCDPKQQYIIYKRDDISESQMKTHQCFRFPDDLHKGKVPLAVINNVKNKCSQVASCKCVDQPIASATEIHLITRVLRREVQRNLKLFSEIHHVLQSKAILAERYIKDSFERLKSIKPKDKDTRKTKKNLVQLSKTLIAHCKEKKESWNSKISEAIADIQKYQTVWYKSMLALIEEKQNDHSFTSLQATAVIQEIRSSCKRIRDMFNTRVLAIENEARECVGSGAQGKVLVSAVINRAKRHLKNTTKK